MPGLRIVLEGSPESIQRVADAIDSAVLGEVDWQESAVESLTRGSIIVKGIERSTVYHSHDYDQDFTEAVAV